MSTPGMSAGDFFSLPPLDPTANPKTLISAVEAQALVDSLPMADPLALGESLLPALQLQNRHPRALPERFEMLFAQMPPVLRMLEDLKQAARTFNFSLSNRKHQQTFKLAEQLVREMGFGFKRLISETILASGRPRASHPERDAQAIYWALQCIALELMLSYSDYLPEPSVAWRESVDLYLMARRLQLSKTPVEDPLEPYSRQMHPGVVFRRILLLAILDPYCMRRGEVWAAYECLGSWAGRVKVGSFLIPNNAAGHFIIDIEGYSKPMMYDPENLPDDTSKYLMLNVTPLNAVVHEYTKELDTERNKLPACLTGLPKPEARQLLKKMLVAWHIAPTRKHPRADKGGWFVGTCGITAVHHQLRAALGDAWTEPRGEMREDEEDETVIEIDDALESGSPAAAIDHHLFRCRQFNISATGMGVLMGPEEFPRVNVGQLILLNPEEGATSTRSRLGVIKRFIRRGGDDLEVGIRLVTGDCDPVIIEITMDNGESLRHPALLVTRGGKPSQIFTPHFVYQSQRHFYLLQSDGSTILSHAGRLIETTCCYDRFEFSMDDG